MIIRHEREKLINAIIFFAGRTLYPGKTKIIKLLYFLDFEHFKATGRSVTGLKYYAWKYGPVPVRLYEEFDEPEPDMAAKVHFKEVETKSKGPMLQIVPLANFEEHLFSAREMDILESLVEEYRNSKAEEMVEATHLPTLPWHRVYHEENKELEEIPYEYAVEVEHELEAIKNLVEDRIAVYENYKYQ